MRCGTTYLAPWVTRNTTAYLGDIQKSGSILLVLINDILDLSKIEAGQYKLKETIGNLGQFLEGAIELATIQARLNDVRFALSASRSLPISAATSAASCKSSTTCYATP